MTTTIPAISAAPTIKKRSAHEEDDHNDKGKRQKKDEEEEEEETTYFEDGEESPPYVYRNFTAEENYIYHKVMFESDNFDCVDVHPDAMVPGEGFLYPIHIDQLPYHIVKIYEDKAKLALTAYNKLHGTSFQWVKIIKATARGYYPKMSYITFQAKDDNVAGSTPQNFQTHVSTFRGVDSIEFCRFEQKPKQVEYILAWHWHAIDRIWICNGGWSCFFFLLNQQACHCFRPRCTSFISLGPSSFCGS